MLRRRDKDKYTSKMEGSKRHTMELSLEVCIRINVLIIFDQCVSTTKNIYKNSEVGDLKNPRIDYANATNHNKRYFIGHSFKDDCF